MWWGTTDVLIYLGRVDLLVLAGDLLCVVAGQSNEGGEGGGGVSVSVSRKPTGVRAHSTFVDGWFFPFIGSSVHACMDKEGEVVVGLPSFNSLRTRRAVTPTSWSLVRVTGLSMQYLKWWW